MIASNRPRQSRFLVWLVALSALAAGGGLGLGMGGWAYDVWQCHIFAGHSNAMEQIVWAWKDHLPPGVEPATWREVVVVSYNALGNVCFSPKHVSIAEMRRLRAEVEGKNREPITVETLDWLWWRLGKTGPRGAKYIRQMQPLWDEAREALRAGGRGQTKRTCGMHPAMRQPNQLLAGARYRAGAPPWTCVPQLPGAALAPADAEL